MFTFEMVCNFQLDVISVALVKSSLKFVISCDINSYKVIIRNALWQSLSLSRKAVTL